MGEMGYKLTKYELYQDSAHMSAMKIEKNGRWTCEQ